MFTKSFATFNFKPTVFPFVALVAISNSIYAQIFVVVIIEAGTTSAPGAMLKMTRAGLPEKVDVPMILPPVPEQLEFE